MRPSRRRTVCLVFERASCTIMSRRSSNPFDDSPDRITSPFYAEDEKPVFVFAGVKLASQEMTQDFVRSKLAGYGVEIRTNVDIHTSFLVALEDYEKTAEFKVAERLGTPILREQELMEFIGY